MSYSPELGDAVEQATAEPAGQMVSLLAPVDAVANRASPGRDKHAQLGEESLPRRRDLVVDVVTAAGELISGAGGGHEPPVAANKLAAVDHGGHQLNAEPSGQVVLASAGCT